MVKLNRNNIADSILQDDDNGEEPSNDYNESSTSGEEEEVNEMNFSITFNAEEAKQLSPKDVSYRSSDRKSLKKTYCILEPGWTGIVNRRILEVTKLPCVFSFKRCKVHPVGRTYLTFRGRCSVCRSSLKGTTENCPSAEADLIFDCIYRGNFKSCAGKKKRRLTKNQRSKFINLMVKEKLSACRVRCMEAAKVMEYGDDEPSDLPTANAFRMMKSRGKQLKYESTDPILSTIQLKRTLPYSTILRDISYDPFFMYYWSSSQINSYRIYTKKNKVPRVTIDATGQLVGHINLSSVNEKKVIYYYEIVIPDKVDKLQFPVAHFISQRHDNVAIAYWLMNWLREDILPPRLCITDQSLALMMACVRAFTQYATLDRYLSACSSLLKKEDNIELPCCMLRNDFAHIMHLVSSWPEVKMATRRSKNFYLRTIALIVACIDYNEVKKLLEYFFVVLLSEEEGCDHNGRPLPCEIAKNDLRQKIAGKDVEWTEIDNDGDETEEIDESEDKVSETSIFEDIQSIYQHCQWKVNNQKTNDDRDNAQYCPKLAARFLKFCKMIAIWSGIMVPIFGYGDPTESSASSESSFKVLKVNLFKGEELPMRLDSFIQTHVQCVIGSINLIGARQKSIAEYSQSQPTALPLKEDIQPSSSVHSSVLPSCQSNKSEPLKVKSVDADQVINTGTMDISPLHQDKNSEDIAQLKKKDEPLPPALLQDEAEENWYGLNKKRKKSSSHNVEVPPRKCDVSKSENSSDTLSNASDAIKDSKRLKLNYLDPDPTILHQNLNSGSKCPIVGHLRNGSLSDLKAIQIEGHHYSITNTCAFDSLSQIMFCAFADSEKYCNFITAAALSDTEDGNSLYFKFIQNVLRDGITCQTYVKRARLLIAMKDSPHPEVAGCVHIDAACTAISLIDKLFAKYPSMSEEKTCVNCGNTTNRNFTVVSVNLPTEDLHFLQDALEASCTDAIQCRKCKTSTKRNVRPKEHLFIEIFSPGYKENFDVEELTVSLRDIPKEVKILDQVFFLRGAISFHKPLSKKVSAIGHFTAYCLRHEIGKWQCFDDLKNSSSKYVRNNTEIKTHILVYTI